MLMPFISEVLVQKPRVLLVDDSKILQVMMRRILETAGFEIVACADDGQLGLDAFRTHQPDFTFLDVTMPNMSGKECLEEILKFKPGAKVFMLSGLADPEVEKSCLQIGAKAFISKSNVKDMKSMEALILNTLNEEAGIAS